MDNINLKAISSAVETARKHNPRAKTTVGVLPPNKRVFLTDERLVIVRLHSNHVSSYEIGKVTAAILDSPDSYYMISAIEGFNLSIIVSSRAIKEEFHTKTENK